MQLSLTAVKHHALVEPQWRAAIPARNLVSIEQAPKIHLQFATQKRFRNYLACTKQELIFSVPESEVANRHRDIAPFCPQFVLTGICPMFKKFVFSCACAATLVGLVSSDAMAQSSQGFTVNVPQSLSIVAPTVAAVISHNETDAPQAFPAQVWAVKGNTRNGVNVTFSTATPFVHSTDSSFKRNAKLDLALGTVQGPATWALGTTSDVTNYVADDGIAQVTASSNGVGRANFNLTVSFITEEYGLFAAGDYVTTVTGTIAAK